MDYEVEHFLRHRIDELQRDNARLVSVARTQEELAYAAEKELTALREEMNKVLFSASLAPNIDAVQLEAKMFISTMAIHQSQGTPRIIEHTLKELMRMFEERARAVLSGEECGPGNWKIPVTMRLRRMVRPAGISSGFHRI
jgi:hypothetical protein